MNNINEKMTHPQNESKNIYTGYGAPAMESFAATSPTGQGVNMGEGPIFGDPEKGTIVNDMHNDGSNIMTFKSAGSDPGSMPLPHGRSYGEFKVGTLESAPATVLTPKIAEDIKKGIPGKIF